MDKITYVYMHSSVWSASLEKNVYLHRDEKTGFIFKKKNYMLLYYAYLYWQVQAYIHKMCP